MASTPRQHKAPTHPTAAGGATRARVQAPDQPWAPNKQPPGSSGSTARLPAPAETAHDQSSCPRNTRACAWAGPERGPHTRRTPPSGGQVSPTHLPPTPPAPAQTPGLNSSGSSHLLTPSPESGPYLQHQKPHTNRALAHRPYEPSKRPVNINTVRPTIPDCHPATPFNTAFYTPEPNLLQSGMYR